MENSRKLKKHLVLKTLGKIPCVAHVVNKVFAKVSKNIFKVKIEKVWH